MADGGTLVVTRFLYQEAGVDGWSVAVSVESPAEFPERLGTDAEDVVLLTGGAEEFEHVIILWVVRVGFYEFHITWRICGGFLKGI